MPTVLRVEGFEFRIPLGDHDPPHVHVYKAGAEVVFFLGGPDLRPRVRQVKDMPVSDVRRGLEICIENQSFLREKWREIHA